MIVLSVKSNLKLSCMHSKSMPSSKNHFLMKAYILGIATLIG